MKWAKRPFPGKEVFIVGEAFSILTGWNEGAFLSAYNALKEGWEIMQPEPYRTENDQPLNDASCRGDEMETIDQF